MQPKSIVYFVEYRRHQLPFSSREKQLEFYNAHQPEAGMMTSLLLDATIAEQNAFKQGQGNSPIL